MNSKIPRFAPQETRSCKNRADLSWSNVFSLLWTRANLLKLHFPRLLNSFDSLLSILIKIRHNFLKAKFSFRSFKVIFVADCAPSYFLIRMALISQISVARFEWNKKVKYGHHLPAIFTYFKRKIDLYDSFLCWKLGKRCSEISKEVEL